METMLQTYSQALYVKMPKDMTIIEKKVVFLQIKFVKCKWQELF